MVTVALLHPADSPRSAGEDEDHAQRLAEVDEPLPPILVHRQTMRVVDGMHRLRAAQIRGATEIAVRFFDGSTIQAYVRGVEENIAHGLPLTLSDRRAAARRILRSCPDWSDRAIARCTGLSAKRVGVLRERTTAALPQLDRRIGLDGKSRPVDPSEGRRR